MTRESYVKAMDIFRQRKGILRTSQGKKLGINESILMQMVEEGLLVKEGCTV